MSKESFINKKDVTKTFCLDDISYHKLSEWAKDRSISKSAAIRILINENCKPIIIEPSDSRG